MATVSTYHNAKDVLPSGLLAEVQRYISGRLWVPTAERQSGQLQQRMVRLYQAGVATRDIAALVGLSQRRVQQIIRAANRGAYRMLNNPKRADAVQDHIHQAVATLTAQGQKLTKRAVAEAAGCSPTTVMKYRALWQHEQHDAESETEHALVALTPDNLSAWQDLEAKFTPMSIGARLLGCRYDQVTPYMAAYWLYQYRRLKFIGERYKHLGLTPKVLRPYKDRTALLEEAVLTRGPSQAFYLACDQQKALKLLQMPLPANQRFLDLPFPTAAWRFLATAMERAEGQIHLEACHDIEP